MVNRMCLIIVAVLLLLTPLARAQNLAPEFAPAGPDVDSSEPVIWEHATLVLVGGWEYADATLAWVGGGKALRVWRSDGATKTMTPDEILKIYDPSGRDITADVVAKRQLGYQPGLAEEVPVSPPGTAGSAWTVDPISPEPPPPLLFRYAVDAGLGYATHAGTWFGGLDDGMNYQVGLRVSTRNDTYLRALYRHQDLGTRSEDIFIDGLGDRNLTIDFTLRDYQFLVGRLGRLVENPSFSSVGYLEFGVSILDNRAVTQDLGGSSLSITKTGLVLQGGLLLLLDELFVADLSASATWKSALLDDDGGGLLMGAHAALGVRY